MVRHSEPYKKLVAGGLVPGKISERGSGRISVRAATQLDITRLWKCECPASQESVSRWQGQPELGSFPVLV